MKKRSFKKYPVGSAEYVILHAQWKKSRGKNPSLSFRSITNPREALKSAKNVIRFCDICISSDEPILKNGEDINETFAGFGLLIALIGGGGDRNNPFPASDADELARGAKFIPGEVTLARRRGERVTFIQNCGQCCWYWQMPDGSRIYHWDRLEYERIARANGVNSPDKNPAGACPSCGNIHTDGGTVEESLCFNDSKEEIPSRFSGRAKQFLDGTGDW